MIKKISKDKRILFIYLFVIVGLSLGFTYAASSNSLGMNIATALISVDEDVYGDTSINTAAIDFRPIIESEVETNTENVIKIEFLVGGASTNTASNVIYDIALVDLDLDCDLISPYIKWKLVKDGTELSNGSLDIGIVNDRLVLTEIQEDLPSYSATQNGYHSYTFYMWFNDSCQAGDIKNCLDTEDQSDLLGKYFSGKIEVELYTESKVGYGPMEEREASSTTACTSYSSKFQLLSSVEPGSYVKYTGNNGCEGESCEGQNANYVDDSNKGYCHEDNVDYPYDFNGWRIAYIDEGVPYLISAGAPECLGTDENGIVFNNRDQDGSPSYLMAGSVMYKHVNNLNNEALRYCNKNFAYGGKCNLSTAWAMNNVDFQQITGSEMSSTSCDGFVHATGAGTLACGTGNDLIDNGGIYWYAFDSGSIDMYYWEARNNIVSTEYGLSGWAYGVRPVLKLADTIIVTGGTGTEDDPYTIANKDNLLLSDIAKPGDYVKYTGTNGCIGESCNGRNANYVDEDNKGYCSDNNYQFLYDGWRVGYIENGSTHLISAGAPECLSTDENGVPSNTDSSTWDEDGVQHFDNANNTSLKYCNSRLASGGKCNLNSVWAFTRTDAEKLDSSFLNSGCLQGSCGLGNDLIDNGGYYWFNDDNETGAYYYWEPTQQYLDYNFQSDYALGVRPVIKLDDSVIVARGSGTYEDPYIIGN